jgi:hypothetical protein
METVIGSAAHAPLGTCIAQVAGINDFPFHSVD